MSISNIHVSIQPSAPWSPLVAALEDPPNHGVEPVVIEPDLENVAFPKWRVASELWLNPEASQTLDGEVVMKVNNAYAYLQEEGFQLGGIEADGNCFCNAFLKSYDGLENTQLPAIDQSENKLAFLRKTIAGQLSDPKGTRAQTLEKDKEWITADQEGNLLATALGIPIRLLTAGVDANSDTLTFSEAGKPCVNWNTIAPSERPLEYIFIVDLGHHFIYAYQPRLQINKKLNLKPLTENPLQETHPSGYVLGIPKSHPYYQAHPEWCENVRSFPTLREAKNYNEKLKACRTKMLLEDTELLLCGVEKEYFAEIDRAISEILKLQTPDIQITARNISKICENVYELLVIPIKEVFHYLSAPWGIYCHNQLEFRESLTQLLERPHQEIPREILEAVLRCMSDNEMDTMRGDLLERYPNHQTLIETLANRADQLIEQAKQLSCDELQNYLKNPTVAPCFNYIFNTCEHLLPKFALMLEGQYGSLKEIPRNFSPTIYYSSYLPKLQYLMTACENFKIDQFEEFKKALEKYGNTKQSIDHFQNRIVPLLSLQQMVRNCMLWPNCYELAEGEKHYLLLALGYLMLIKPSHGIQTPMIPYQYLAIPVDDQKRAQATLKKPKATAAEKREACRLLLHADIPWGALQNIGKLLDRSGGLKQTDSSINQDLVGSSLYDIIPELSTVYEAIERLIQFELTEFDPKAPLVSVENLPEKDYTNIKLLGGCSEIRRDVTNIYHELLRWDNLPILPAAFSTAKLEYAVLRTLQMVGEVTKNLRRGGLLSSDAVWRDLESLRDLLAHPERMAVYKKLKALTSGSNGTIFAHVIDDFKILLGYFKERINLLNNANDWNERKKITKPHETFFEFTGMNSLCDFLADLLPGRIAQATKEQLKATVCNEAAEKLRKNFVETKNAILECRLTGPSLEQAVQILPLSGADQKKLKESTALLTSPKANQIKRMLLDKQSTTQEMIAMLKNFKDMKKIPESSPELIDLNEIFESIKSSLQEGVNEDHLCTGAAKAQIMVDCIIKQISPEEPPILLKHLTQKLTILIESLPSFLQRKQQLCHQLLSSALYEEEWELESLFDHLVRDIQYHPMEVAKLELRLKKFGMTKADIAIWKGVDAKIKKSEAAQKQQKKTKEMTTEEHKKQIVLSINLIMERILELDSLLRLHPEMNDMNQFIKDPLMQLSCEYLISGFRRAASNLELHLHSIEIPEISVSDIQDSLLQSIEIANQILHSHRITNPSSLTPHGHAFNIYLQSTRLIKNYSLGPGYSATIDSLNYKLAELKKILH